MNAADVVVLPYIKIFTSGTLLLAMSYSKSIIAPNLGLIPDILDDKGGILYEKGDLEKALSNILNINLEKCGEYNYKKIKNLDWNNIADKTNEVYMDCLQNCKKSK
jgi:glycosyltransferase involved in cell wall biosynthesis